MFVMRFHLILFICFKISALSSAKPSIQDINIGASLYSGIRYGSSYYTVHDLKLSYSAGVIVNFKINNLISLSSGMQFAIINSQSKFRKPFSLVPDRDSTISFIRNKKNGRYIEFPLMINYYFGRKSTKFIFSAGLISNYFINAKSTLTIIYNNGIIENRNTTSSVIDSKRIHVNPNVAFGIERKIGNNVSLCLQPFLRLNSVKFTNTVSFKDYSLLGLNLCVFRNYP